MGQAEDRRLQIEGGQGLAIGHHLGDARQRAEQLGQPRISLHHHARPACRRERRIAGELDIVAQALLAMDQHCLAGQIPAPPGRPGEFQRRRPGAPGPGAPFMLGPAFLEAPHRQERQAEIPMGADIVGRGLDGGAVEIRRFGEVAPVLQHAAEIELGYRRGRQQRDGGAAGGLGLGQASHILQHIAEIGVDLAAARIVLQRGAEGDDRFLQTAEILQGATEIGQRVGMGGLQIEGPAVGQGRGLGPAQLIEAITQLEMRLDIGGFPAQQGAEGALEFGQLGHL